MRVSRKKQKKEENINNIFFEGKPLKKHLEDQIEFNPDQNIKTPLYHKPREKQKQKKEKNGGVIMTSQREVNIRNAEIATASSKFHDTKEMTNKIKAVYILLHGEKICSTDIHNRIGAHKNDCSRLLREINNSELGEHITVSKIKGKKFYQLDIDNIKTQEALDKSRKKVKATKQVEKETKEEIIPEENKSEVQTSEEICINEKVHSIKITLHKNISIVINFQ